MKALSRIAAVVLFAVGSAAADPLDHWDRARAPAADKIEQTLASAAALLEQADGTRNPDAKKDLQRSARSMLEAVGAESSPDVRLRFALGRAVHRLDDDTRTIEILEPALAMAPEHPQADDALLWLAVAYARSNRPADEIRAYDRLLPNAQGNLRVLILSNRAESRLRLADFDGAISDYEEAIRLDPSGSAAFWGLSITLDRTGDLGRALVIAKEAHDLDRRRNVPYFENPNVFFVPAYEIEWYRALDDAMMGAQTDRAPADRLESWLSAAARWEAFLAKATKDERWVPLAKARRKSALAAAQRLEREVRKTPTPRKPR
jgi:tetratricopeptide (TPR) repeat protein